MRARLTVAVATFILVGAGVKLILFSDPAAAVDIGSTKGVGIDISKMQQNIRNLPVENVHDMTFVFSHGD